MMNHFMTDIHQPVLWGVDDGEARPVNLVAAYFWLTENTEETYASDLTTFGGMRR